MPNFASNTHHYNKDLGPSLTPELICSDIKSSLLFYTTTLGFNIHYQREEEGFAMLEREGANIMLDEIKNSSGTYSSWISAPLEPPLGRGINLQIKTKNVEALYHHTRKMGANIFLSIETKWYRVNNAEVEQRQFIVLDPDGYMLRFAESLSTRVLHTS